MHSGLFWLRSALVVALAFTVQSCGKNKAKAAPAITAVIPTTITGIVPNIVIQFDRAMDPATAGNPANYFVVPSPLTTSISFRLEFLANLNEVRLIPSLLLAGGTNYTVYVSGVVASAAGTALGTTFNFGFSTAASPTTTSQLSWAGATAAQGTNPGQIVVSWTTNAQETTTTQLTPADIVGNYDVYLSTTSESEDLLLPYFTTGTTSPITLSGLVTGTTYYLKVQPRDSNGCVFLPLTEISAVAK